MWRSPSALVLMFSLLLLASSAQAAPTLLTNSYLAGFPESDLALAGSATLVASPADPGAQLVSSYEPPRPVRVVARTPMAYPEDGYSLIFAASSSRIAVLTSQTVGAYKGNGGSEVEKLESGLLGGGMSPLTAGCPLAPGLDRGLGEREAGLSEHTNVAVDGEVVAYDSFGCVVVVDRSTGLQRTIALPATLDPFALEVANYPGGRTQYEQSVGEWETKLRVAGRLVAYRVNPAAGAGQAFVAVADIDTGQTVYSAPLPRDLRYANELVSPTFALQSDGTLLIADARTCTATVSTPQEPTPRALGTPVCAVRAVDDGRALVVVPLAHEQRQLAWTPLGEPRIHPIVALGRYGSREATQATMNETDVAYAQGDCWGARVYRAPLSHPASPPAPPARCPVIVSAHRASVDSDHLSVRIRCPHGCEGELMSAELRGAGPKAFLEAEAGYSLRPGQSDTLILLTREDLDGGATLSRVARELRAGRHVHVELEFETRTPNATGICRECGEGQQGEPKRAMGVTYSLPSRVTVPLRGARG
jgi:hypothetical protein